MGSTNLDAYDAASRRFTTEQKVYVNSVGTLRFLAENVQKLGLKDLLCVWTVPCLRTIGAFSDAGWLGSPLFVCLVLTEGGILGGHPGTVRGLDSLLEFLPRAAPLEWSVCCREGNLFAVSAAAIERGGHVSIGLGDYAYPELGHVRNCELVQRIVDQAALQGRAIASVAETRAMLGMNSATH
jgi:3-keto-5-aminohexanoate cleavage enzyme